MTVLTIHDAVQLRLRLVQHSPIEQSVWLASFVTVTECQGQQGALMMTSLWETWHLQQINLVLNSFNPATGTSLRLAKRAARQEPFPIRHRALQIENNLTSAPVHSHPSNSDTK